MISKGIMLVAYMTTQNPFEPLRPDFLPFLAFFFGGCGLAVPPKSPLFVDFLGFWRGKGFAPPPVLIPRTFSCLLTHRGGLT